MDTQLYIVCLTYPSNLSSIDLSIIIPCLNEGDNVERTVYNIIKTIGIKGYEIIIVNSGGTQTTTIKRLSNVHVYDSPIRLGAPQARNIGASKSTGSFLLFVDGHVIFRNNCWGSKILKDMESMTSMITGCITVLGNENSVAYGFKWRNLKMDVEWLNKTSHKLFEVPFAGGTFMAIKKSIFDEIGQFDNGIRFYGHEDSEISLRTWLFGYRVICDPSIELLHRFKDSFPYDLDYIDVFHNEIRVAFSHFSSGRLYNYIKESGEQGLFHEAFVMNLMNHVLDRRLDLFKKRLRTDDWFFEKFPISDEITRTD